MKVFISADIEGISITNSHEECGPSHANYSKNCQQMTREVLAACQGAFAAGAKEIVIKDSHGPGTNIDPIQLPENVTLLRNWTGHPYSMVQGVDSTFDAAFFVGYHAAAGRPGNPLSHTMTGRPAWIKLNGRFCSEFMLYSWACALEGVPTVLLTGDRMLCEDDGDLHPGLVTVHAKEGLGYMTRVFAPVDVERRIREGAERALKQDLPAARATLPQHFRCEIFFKDQAWAEKVSHFPGVSRLESNLITFERDDYFEVLRTIKWII